MANKQISQTEVKTQVDKILWHLQNHGTITSFEAYNTYRITRLASCIEILRNKRGYTINTEYVSHRLASDSLFPNAKNSKGTHAKYKYIGVNAIDNKVVEQSTNSHQVDLTKTFDESEADPNDLPNLGEKTSFFSRVFTSRK